MADSEQFDEEEQYGIALGVGIIEDGGKMFLAEAEVAPYVDTPDELGVTLVFHPLDGMNPIEMDEEIEWPSWPIDIDDDLDRDGADPMERQFSAIVRQLHGLGEAKLRAYMKQAKADAEG